MNRKKWIALLCAAALLVVMTACREEPEEQPEEPAQETVEETQPEEPEEEEPEEEAPAKTMEAGVTAEEALALYAPVLEANRDGILGYDWQQEVEQEYRVMDPARPVAFCDISGDGVPELFYMTSTGPAESFLHISTVVNGEVREMMYPFDENETGLMSDIAAGGGNEYILYTGTDGRFYLYYVSNNETSVYAVYTDEIENAQLRRVSKALNVMSPVYGEDGMMEDEMENIYYVDDQEVDASAGTAAFNAAFDQLDQVILYSGYDAGSVWKKVAPDKALCQSYEDALNTAKGAAK